MPIPVRISMGEGRYGLSGEEDYTMTTWFGGSGKPALLFQHGRGSTARSNYEAPAYQALFRELAEEYTVCVHDNGGNLNWGGPAGRNSLGNVKNFLQNNFGTTGKMGLVCISMGGGSSFAYTKTYTGQVAFVAGITPLTNVNDLRFYQTSTDSNDGVTTGPYNSEINAAYGGSYSDATYGADYNFHYFRASYPATTVKTALWYSLADTVTRPQWVANIKAAQPAIETFAVKQFNGSSWINPDHANAALVSITGVDSTTPNNPPTDIYYPRVADWCFDRRLDSF